MITEDMKVVGYVDLTPTWQEILPTWKLMVDNATKTTNDTTMCEFWGEMQRMADSADRYTFLLEELRRDYNDEDIGELLENGKERLLARRRQIKPVEAE